MPLLLSISGPTASGKTALAVRLAQRLNAVVISADSRQVFRRMDIGTAKPAPEEMGGVRHYCIDEAEPDGYFSAGMFARRVDEILTEEFQNRDVVILAGGSGLYFHAVWHGFDEIPEIPEAERIAVRESLEKLSLEELQQQARQADPVSFAQMDTSNPARLKRLLEVYRFTGSPMSAFQNKKPAEEKLYQDLKFALDLPREELYVRINHRVLHMMDAGLEEETRRLLRDYGPDNALLHTLGYAELLGFFEGKTSREEAIALIQRNTRRYAKRQLTWFRRYDDIRWISPSEDAAVLEAVQKWREDY